MLLKLCLFVTTLTIISGYVEVSGFSRRSVGDGNSASHEDLVETVFNNTGRAFPQKSADNIANSTVNLKMATVCETPNGDVGFCLGIRQCQKLLNQLANMKARNFLRESMCGPYNEDRQNPKVCCGQSDNYRNVSEHIAKNIPSKADDLKRIFPKRCGIQRTKMSGRIIGGTEAQLGEFPWMARLEHKTRRGAKSLGCSGFLVHAKYVLTAAHCVDEGFVRARGPLFAVILGEHDSESKIDCDVGNRSCADPPQISRVAKVIVHPGYDSQAVAHYNDIALVHLNKGARWTEYVQPICLLTDSSKVVPQKYFLSGWGKTSEDVPMSPVKMKIDIPAADKSSCSERYFSLLGIDLAPTQICAGGEPDRDSCNGDSGGPLMLPVTDREAGAGRGSSTTWYAAGIVSFGIGCGVEGWPGVYTNVVEFVPWIEEEMAKNSLVAGVKGPGKVKKKRRRNQQTGL
ncbi:unnamed protein product [Phaedon cochleariae]|uniref:CLIP domain-containing serine protease n=1 Tax=Phaedon cochleariae TaxID=80249 RepID=A0A9N9SHE6_PHACE|nr:unnamed protein product [Phaedon cochleariae]